MNAYDCVNIAKAKEQTYWFDNNKRQIFIVYFYSALFNICQHFIGFVQHHVTR